MPAASTRAPWHLWVVGIVAVRARTWIAKKGFSPFCATYVAMYRMMKATGAPAALCAIPVVGAAAHFTYVLLQIPDGWYREYADNYEEPTLWNGLLLRYKMPAASIDAAFYAIGLGHLLASLPAKKTLLPVAVGALAGLAAWKPWAREEQPAKQEAAV